MKNFSIGPCLGAKAKATEASISSSLDGQALCFVYNIQTAKLLFFCVVYNIQYTQGPKIIIKKTYKENGGLG